VRDGLPWLPVEVKLGDADPAPSWRRFVALLPCKRGIQILRRPTWKTYDAGDIQVLVAGAAEILTYLV